MVQGMREGIKIEEERKVESREGLMSVKVWLGE